MPIFLKQTRQLFYTLGFRRVSSLHEMASSIDKDSVVLVIGASRGIGLEFVKQCLERLACVIATERKEGEDLRKLEGDGRLHIISGVVVGDSSSYSNVRYFFQAHSLLKLSHIIHNAGIFGRRIPLAESTPEDLSAVLNVNTIGVLSMLQFVLRYTIPGIAIWAVVSSKMGSISQNEIGGSYAYRASKAALNMICKNISIDLKDKLAVVILHPGYVATEMNGLQGKIESKESVEGMLREIDCTDKRGEMRFVSWEGHIIPW